MFGVWFLTISQSLESTVEIILHPRSHGQITADDRNTYRHLCAHGQRLDMLSIALLLLQVASYSCFCKSSIQGV